MKRALCMVFILIVIATRGFAAQSEYEFYLDNFPPTISPEEALDFAKSRDSSPSEVVKKGYYVIMYNDILFNEKTITWIRFDHKTKTLDGVNVLISKNYLDVFKKIEAALTKKYGPPKDVDELKGPGMVTIVRWETPNGDIRLDAVGHPSLNMGNTGIRYKCTREKDNK